MNAIHNNRRRRKQLDVGDKGNDVSRRGDSNVCKKVLQFTVGGRQTNKLNALAKTVSDFLDDHHLEEYEYYLSLVNPLRSAARLPSFVPIPTGVMQMKSTFAIPITGTGARVVLDPWSVFNSGSNAILYYNGVANTDAGVGADVGAFQAPTTSFFTYFASWRPTSAYLEVTPVGSDLTEQGYHSMAYIPDNTASWYTGTADPVRDALGCKQSEKHKRISKVWMPLDFANQSFATSAPAKRGMIIYIGSGLSSTMSLRVRYCINYEYVPNSSNTDILVTETAQGSLNSDLLSKVVKDMDHPAVESMINTAKLARISDTLLTKHPELMTNQPSTFAKATKFVAAGALAKAVGKGVKKAVSTTVKYSAERYRHRRQPRQEL